MQNFVYSSSKLDKNVNFYHLSIQKSVWSWPNRLRIENEMFALPGKNVVSRITKSNHCTYFHDSFLPWDFVSGPASKHFYVAQNTFNNLNFNFFTLLPLLKVKKSPYVTFQINIPRFFDIRPFLVGNKKFQNLPILIA